MVNLDKLEYKRKELITDFSEEELKRYLELLSNNYYYSFINNDSKQYNNTVKELEEVISIFRSQYSDIKHYINFCLLATINKILNENYSSGIELTIVATSEEDFFSDYPFKNLVDSLEESRELYFNDIEMEKRIKKLEQENKNLKEQLKDELKK